MVQQSLLCLSCLQQEKQQGGKFQAGGKALEKYVEEKLVWEGGTVRRCLNCWLWSHYDLWYCILQHIAAVCGQQTHTSLEQVSQPPSPPPQPSPWPGCPSSILKCPSVSGCGPGGKDCSPCLKSQVAALLLLQTVPLEFGMSQREPLHPQLSLFPKLSWMWIRSSAAFTSHFKQRERTSSQGHWQHYSMVTPWINGLQKKARYWPPFSEMKCKLFAVSFLVCFT